MQREDSKEKHVGIVFVSGSEKNFLYCDARVVIKLVIMGERQKKWNKSKKNSIEHIPS
jgi:hypothetical protein